MADKLPNLGWAPEHEPKHTHRLSDFTPIAMCAAPATIPDIHELNWVQDEQGPTLFCHSHMSTGMLECLDLLAQGDGGKVRNFSRYFSAIMNMRQDGDDSQMAGASISGSILVATEIGSPLEDLMPWIWYDDQNHPYSNRIPAVALAGAMHHKLKSLIPNIRSYEEMDKWAVTGRAVMGFGMDWTTGMDSLRGVKFCSRTPPGSYRGGHALTSSLSWITRAGERWYALDNSHLGWGDGESRRCYMSPGWWDHELAVSRFGAQIATDIEVDDINPQPRELSFAEPGIIL